MEIPDGMSPDAASTWPPTGLIEDFLGNFDFSPLGDGVHAPTPEEVEAAREFRGVLGRFASGVTIVTAEGPDGPIGMTLQSFTSVSLEPPLVLIVPAKTSHAWPLIRRAGHFTVNLLAAGQEELSNQFARSGGDKFAGVPWSPSPLGDPHLGGALAWIDCRVHAVHEAGDHFVVLGAVDALTVGEAEEPLVFYRSAYRSLG
ncbi:flavin reductase family protein [Nocardioides sp. Kera G14]|uniref:flavin reductase family protein n=1 Tax=Nocardioides sp. Kera G14 TaxID=2884264 RepID=UPI001D102683|nr:flavin reductase family protein [Nocardioides sp. Kera G14]UDY22276.1 flavin reductase family protein [Nocardioides sp. Kera G14]